MSLCASKTRYFLFKPLLQVTLKYSSHAYKKYAESLFIYIRAYIRIGSHKMSKVSSIFTHE